MLGVVGMQCHVAFSDGFDDLRYLIAVKLDVEILKHNIQLRSRISTKLKRPFWGGGERVSVNE